MSFIRYKKFGNKEYAYEVETHWDPEAKIPGQKTKYLGVVVDKEKKIFERPRQKPREKIILDFGDGYLVQEFLGYIQISQTSISFYIPSFQGTSSFYRVLKQAGICAGILRSPTMRKMMPEKASNVRNPLALFLAILIILFNPSAMALVNLVSANGSRRSSYHAEPEGADGERTPTFYLWLKNYMWGEIVPKNR